MTQTKHTQGPWRTSLTEGQRAWNVSSEATGRTVAIVSDWSPEAEANARLIAAAPELLEALKSARFAIQVTLDSGLVTEKNVRSTLNHIDAAIAKAEGGAQ